MAKKGRVEAEMRDAKRTDGPRRRRQSVPKEPATKTVAPAAAPAVTPVIEDRPSRKQRTRERLRACAQALRERGIVGKLKAPSNAGLRQALHRVVGDAARQCDVLRNDVDNKRRSVADDETRAKHPSLTSEERESLERLVKNGRDTLGELIAKHTAAKSVHTQACNLLAQFGV